MFEEAREIKIGFGKLYGVDRLVIILNPTPSNIYSVEENKE